MRKLLVLLCLLLALGLFAVCAIGATVSKGRDQVTFSPRHLYGDPTAAQDATLTMRADFDSHLLWDITYPIGGEAQTDFRVSLRELSFEGRPNLSGINMYEDMEYGLDTRKSPEELEGIERAYRELFDRTEPGTKGTAEIRLQDYYTYYPIRIDIHLPGTLWHGLDYEDLASDDFANERAVWDAFRAFFRISIPDDLPAFEISVVKNVDGSIGGVGSSAPKEGKHYSFYAEAAHTSDTCYLAITNRYGEGYVDTSLIPGGYGIYSFTYTNVRNDKNTQGNVTVFHPGYVTGVHAETLAMVYPLDESILVREMFVTPDEEHLLVICEDRAGAVSLLVIDAATMAQIQTIPVTENEWVSIHQEDDFFVLFYDKQLSVYERCADGSYTRVLTGEQPYAVNGAFGDVSANDEMDLEGGRLIIVSLLKEPRYRSMLIASVSVAVYDASGLTYYGEYDNSLAVNPITNIYDDNVNPLAYEIKWQSSGDG